MDELKGQIDRYLQIKKGNERYGEGEPHAQAAAFYREFLMKPLMANALARTQDKEQEVDLLISIAGFTPMTSIMTCHILKPKRVFLLTSAKAAEHMEEVLAWLYDPQGGGFSFRDVSHNECPPTDPMRIYQIIKERVRSLGQDNPRVVIDITGGKKVMSAAAALCAWQMDLKLSYIESSDYDPELRMPVPGDEHLLLIQNPTNLFRDAETAALETLADKGAFDAAAIGFEKLSKQVTNPWHARIRDRICRLYNAWSNLDIEALERASGEVRQILHSPNMDLAAPQVQRLEAQLTFLDNLRQELDPERQQEHHKQWVLLCYYLLGRYYMQQSRDDFAALLFYRASEGCMTSHLVRRHPGLKIREVSPEAFSRQGVDPEALRARYSQAAAEVFQGEPLEQLPERLGFMTSALLLFSLEEDALLPGAHIHDIKALHHLRRQTDIRNNSILAHGFKTIKREQCKELESLARRLLQSFWSQHQPGKPLDEVIEELTFLQFRRGAAPVGVA
jgi:CRISPR-associated protein (TIGR02710 family)